MSLNSLRYVCKETLLSLRRNAWMSLASVATVAISLIILGFAITLVYNTNQLAANVESDIEISVFLKDLNTDRVQDLKTRVEGIAEVSSVELIGKDQALQQFQSSLSTELLANLGGVNPLPDKLTVKVTQPETVKIVADKISDLEGVDKVNYGQGIVEKILKFTRWVRFVGSTVISLLAVASIVLISITIRLTVFARRREIQVMKLVGATDWFIRWPFLLEGMILGVFGSVLASFIVGYSYLGLVSYLQSNLTFIPVRNDQNYILYLTAIMLGAGAVIGMVGSMVSLRKFLKV